MLTITAHAKINLTLEIMGERPDGYHEIASVLQTIDLGDTISFEPGDSIRLLCCIPSLSAEDNLAFQAARLLQKSAGITAGATIHLKKAIPIEAGLGGASSDAAATLLGLNQLWGLGLPVSRLDELARRLGSDVPFFLYGGTALATGRGEELSSIPSPPSNWLVLVVPPWAEKVPNKTGMVYSCLKARDFTRGQYTHRLAHILRLGNPISALYLFNGMERASFDFFQVLGDYRKRFMEAGASSVHLAGSGPALFTLARNREEGEALLQRLLQQDLSVYLTTTVGEP